MRRTVVALLLIAFKLGLGAAAQEPFITVAVYNRAAMKTETLLSGEREASRILGTAGVPMHWQNCRTATGGVGDNCLAAMNDNTLVLTIVSRSPQQALKPYFPNHIQGVVCLVRFTDFWNPFAIHSEVFHLLRSTFSAVRVSARCYIFDSHHSPK